MKLRTYRVRVIERSRTADDHPLFDVRWTENGKRQRLVLRDDVEAYAENLRKEGHKVLLS